MNIPMKRHGKPDEVADLILFLISDHAKYITGESIVIDGGLSLIIQEDNMKESFYNIKFQHNGLNFIYNTKNSKLITFDNYDNLFANHYSDFVSNGFLVADDFNEFEEVVNKRSEYLSKEKDYKRFTILPTTKCNANCSFCYENDSPRYDMSDEVVEQTINFIKQESQEKKKIRV